LGCLDFKKDTEAKKLGLIHLNVQSRKKDRTRVWHLRKKKEKGKDTLRRGSGKGNALAKEEPRKRNRRAARSGVLGKNWGKRKNGMQAVCGRTERKERREGWPYSLPKFTGGSQNGKTLLGGAFRKGK